MQEIDLRRIDLNLLLVFDVLMTERNVTRAAHRLGRTQSAVSHALARLREQLDDPLLVKTAQGMKASPFAERVAEQVRPILADIARALTPRQSFEAARSERVFRLAAPDFATAFFPQLQQQVLRLAPAVALEWMIPNESTQVHLLEGHLDLAIVPASVRLADGIEGSAAGALHWTCFARREHPAWKDWDSTAWSRWPHVVVRVGDRLSSPVTQSIGAQGIQRRIGAWVPNFSAVAPLLAHSDLIATLPSLTLMDTLDRYGLESHPVPFDIAPIPQMLIWSTRHGADPAVIWLREQVNAVWQAQLSQAQSLM